MAYQKLRKGGPVTAAWTILDVDDPETWGTAKAELTARLFHLQRGRCAGCGKIMTPRCGRNNGFGPSIDHVFPKCAETTRDFRRSPRIRKLRKRFYVPPTSVYRTLAGGDPMGRWDKVAMHRRCNSAKGHRAPTGCELIWLMAVCARIRGEEKEAT